MQLEYSILISKKMIPKMNSKLDLKKSRSAGLLNSLQSLLKARLDAMTLKRK
jgi:hypothetical protein